MAGSKGKSLSGGGEDRSLTFVASLACRDGVKTSSKPVL